MLEREYIEQLFQRCYDKLLKLAQNYLNDQEEARDTVSDVFTHIADSSIKLPQENPEGYLFVCVRNKCLERIRHLSLRERLKRNLTMDTERIIPLETEEERVQELMAYAERSLAPQICKVFMLRFNEGLKYREIAIRLSISEVTVYNHLAQALRQLRSHFKYETR